MFRSLLLYIIPCNSLCGGCSEFIVWRLQGSAEKEWERGTLQSRTTFSQQRNLIWIYSPLTLYYVFTFLSMKTFVLHCQTSFMKFMMYVGFYCFPSPQKSDKCLQRAGRPASLHGFWTPEVLFSFKSNAEGKRGHTVCNWGDISCSGSFQWLLWEMRVCCGSFYMVCAVGGAKVGRFEGDQLSVSSKKRFVFRRTKDEQHGHTSGLYYKQIRLHFTDVNIILGHFSTVVLPTPVKTWAVRVGVCTRQLLDGELLLCLRVQHLYNETGKDKCLPCCSLFRGRISSLACLYILNKIIQRWLIYSRMDLIRSRKGKNCFDWFDLYSKPG